jgi:branched-chain amino acid transport system substrate-binding protein
MNKLLNTLISFSISILVANGANAADTLKIALTGPFTGGSAAMGVSSRDGAKLAIKEINDQGGVDVGGKKMKIEVIERDDEGKNERGALVAQELSGMADINAVVGTVNTGIAISGDKNYQAAKMIKIITPAAGTASMSQWAKPEVTDLYVFRFSANDGIQASMVVDEAVKKLGFKKVAIMHDDTNYGVSGRDDLLKNLTKYPDVKVVDTEKFSIGDKDMTAQITKIKASGAEAILIWGIGPELAAISNAMHTLGLNIPYIGGWTLSMSSYLDNAGKNADGTLTPQAFIEEPYSKAATAFIDAYHKEYKVQHMPSPMSAAEGYDAIKVLAAAFHQAGSTDPTKVRDALEDLKEPVPGVIKTWVKPYSKWDPSKPDTHEAFRSQEVVMAVVKNDHITFAHEEDRKRMQELAVGPQSPAVGSAAGK